MVLIYRFSAEKLLIPEARNMIYCQIIKFFTYL